MDIVQIGEFMLKGGSQAILIVGLLGMAWLLNKKNKRIDELVDRIIEKSETYAGAMAEARVVATTQTEQVSKTVDKLSRVVENISRGQN